MLRDSLPQQASAQNMRLALAQNAILGEGLQWNSAQSKWWWTDIDAATVHAWSPGNQQVLNYRLPDRVGSFAHCRSGRLLLGLSKRLGFATVPEIPANGMIGVQNLAVQALVAVDPAESRTRINDGRTDRRGFFVFGTFNEATEKRSIASFYQYSLQYGLRRLALPAVAIANSICFSLDGKTMYFTDTLTRRIQQCDYDAESARVSHIRLFTQMDDPLAYPDGSVVDKNGCLWNAQWGAASIVQYSPAGELIQRIHVPVKNPTCPAFGGVNSDQLMVTTSRKDMSAKELASMPAAGSLFSLQLDDRIGIEDSLFDDSSEAMSIISTKTKTKTKARQS
ncbi:L-arabinonolactonase [Undibacterium sp. GrIS 1.8]|uniref:SMP-30/gluconolactonase/LRE family protein n=1 Tax=unclassified Undibacterium TaxID=2630295 RepID=UPI0033916548